MQTEKNGLVLQRRFCHGMKGVMHSLKNFKDEDLIF